MKILHITSYHSTISTGGTEIFIDSFVKESQNSGHTNHILVYTKEKVSHNENNIDYIEDNSPNVEKLTAKLIVQFKPDILCVHSSEGAEINATEYASQHYIPYLFFLHTLCWICYQRSLLYCGKDPCTRQFSPWRCAFCMTAQVTHSGIIAFAKCVINTFANIVGISKGSWYRSGKTELPIKRAIISNAEEVVVFSKRQRELIMNRQSISTKVVYLPHGLSRKTLEICKENALKIRQGILKFGYVGRCTKEKGVDLLVNAAMRLSNDFSFELRIYGCDSESHFCRELQDSSHRDSRIKFFPILSQEEILLQYADLDVLCIPSRVNETGPMTLLEGAYSGCYLLSSPNVGNIDFAKENGLVLNNNTEEEWLSHFEDCLANKEQIRAIKKHFDTYLSYQHLINELENCSLQFISKQAWDTSKRI